MKCGMLQLLQETDVFIIVVFFIFPSVRNIKIQNCRDVNRILFAEDACVLKKSFLYKVGRDCFM
jgi:hypothetical protein